MIALLDLACRSRARQADYFLSIPRPMFLTPIFLMVLKNLPLLLASRRIGWCCIHLYQWLYVWHPWIRLSWRHNLYYQPVRWEQWPGSNSPVGNTDHQLCHHQPMAFLICLFISSDHQIPCVPEMVCCSHRDLTFSQLRCWLHWGTAHSLP